MFQLCCCDKEIYLVWISLFGSPNRVFSNNDEKFESSEFKDKCENLNIKVVTLPVEAQCSNGICKQHNHILTETLLKIKR